MNRRRQGTVKRHRIAIVIVAAIIALTFIWGPVATAISYAKSIPVETQWGDTFRIHVYEQGMPGDCAANVLYRGTYFWNFAGEYNNVEDAFEEPECLFQKDGYNENQIQENIVDGPLQGVLTSMRFVYYSFQNC